MPSGWLDQVSAQDILIALGAVVIVVGGIWLVVKFVHPVMVKVVRVLDLILGRPDEQGIPGKPSMMARFDQILGRLAGQDKVLERQNAAIAEIKAEVTPNHGGSAHDAITNRIDSLDIKVGSLDAKVGAILTALEDNGIKPA